MKNQFFFFITTNYFNTKKNKKSSLFDKPKKPQIAKYHLSSTRDRPNSPKSIFTQIDQNVVPCSSLLKIGLWSWMAKFKDTVFAIALEHGSVGTKLLALKFLETFFLLFRANHGDTESPTIEGFNISWLVGGHPVINPYLFISEANRNLGILLYLLQSASSLHDTLTIAIVN
ncbi:hypothetical protein UlMin_010143 [Ulmus minor]